MSTNFDKLVTLLKELFQLDQPDLDFGIYRIMHAKAGEVTQFLEKDLLPQVKEAFEHYQPADRAELLKNLREKEARYLADGVDPASVPAIQTLRERLNEAVDIAALESEVYDHLYAFFRRYYSEGDFLARRVYKPGVYAIPYEGEEVSLYWANRDQYYIKTSEYLRDYSFRLRPDNEERPMRVHFRLADAAEEEHGNVKATEEKDRVFILSEKDFIGEEDGELLLCFEYRPARLSDWPVEAREVKTKPPSQKELLNIASRRVLSVADSKLSPWIRELGATHVKADGEPADYTRLEAHLRRYTARNTFDYFIHKDLGTFLRRELDFYIKNEVMHLDDVENESAPRVEQYLSKIKVIRRIAGKIIDFLAQLEDFQNKLWLKKKFVVESGWCITLDLIPKELYPDIIDNLSQYNEWVSLFAIDKTFGFNNSNNESSPLTIKFLMEHPGLSINTKHFNSDFIDRLISNINDLDSTLNGLLIHSDNFHALQIMQSKFQNHIDCIYIDPPYNTGKGDFLYKDQYRSSSWLSAIHDRTLLAFNLLTEKGIFMTSIADHELDNMRLCMHDIWGRNNLLANLVWNNEGNIDNQSKVKLNHEYILAYCRNERAYDHALVIAPDIESNSKLYNETIENSITKNGPANPPSIVTLPAGFPATFEIGSILPRKDEWPHLLDEVNVLDSHLVKPARVYSGWSSRNLLDKFIENGCHAIRDAKGLLTWFKITHTGAIYGYKQREHQSHVLSVIRNVGTVKKTSGMLERMGFHFSYPKPVDLIEYLLRFTNVDNSYALDYYAGSGTTAHAAINLKRNANIDRRYILVDNGVYLDTIILPRIRKIVYAPEWYNEEPTTHKDSISHFIKYIRLESYEDTLNNLKLKRSADQQSLLDHAQARGAGGLREEYMLRYMLDVEARGSASLLTIDAFSDPTAYTLKVKRPGSDESREVHVDLIETFNWLIGITVRHISTPQTFSAKFERDAEKRLRVKGRIKQESGGPWWFRTVSGVSPDGRRTLVIWRKLTGNAEEDNLVLDEWFTRQGYSSKDSEFDLIYVNGDNNLENLKTPDDTWKVRLIEEDFHRLMFAMEGA
ncbi:MAG: DNA methyltransferase [Spirochaetota bacterium]